eukprot:8810692-Pyramimonas_sp.AAC.1
MKPATGTSGSQQAAGYSGRWRLRTAFRSAIAGAWPRAPSRRKPRKSSAAGPAAGATLIELCVR